MQKIQILLVCPNALILQKLSSFINEKEEWESVATTDDESAIELFHQREFDIVVLINEMEAASENKLSSVFTFKNPDLIIIKHVGDSTEILKDEIEEALQKRKKPVKIVDDVFKDKKED